MLPSLLSPHAEPGTWVFIIFYGLDWVATVPPTIVLCRDYFGPARPIVFGWVFASHQLGAAIAAAGAGWIRTCRAPTTLACLPRGGVVFRGRAAVRRGAQAGRRGVRRTRLRSPGRHTDLIRRRGDAGGFETEALNKSVSRVPA